jgi:integrase
LQSYADEHCSSPKVNQLRKQWSAIQAALDANGRAPKSIPTFAISKSIAPADFSNEDLERWGAWMIRRGRKLRTLKQLKWQFRRTLIQSNLEHHLPSLNCRAAAPKYAVAKQDMPAELRTEIATLLEWKQARFARGRPSRAQHRASSAKLTEQYVRRLYGFASKVARLGEFTSLEELFSERVVTAFVDWGMNQRRLSRSSLSRLSLIAAAMKHHPRYEDVDLAWFDALVSELPKDDENARLERKRKKYVPHEVLVTIPGKIRVAAHKERDPVQRAWYAHDELLLTWLTTLPWRQDNLRHCRIGDGNQPNIFSKPVPQLVHIAKPIWVQERLKLNPEESFWQFHFSKDETKTDRPVRGFLPRRLIGVLETYLRENRPLLCGGTDPGTLFLNREGGALTRQLVTDLVGQITFQHTGTQMPPHLFRDAFSYAWLNAHPQDYLSLSKILWHVSLEYTLRVYARNFDESNGACRVDEWLG